MIYDLLCCGPQRIRYIQSLYSDLGILAFSAFPEQLFQWHDEENSSYTATALYGNLTRFHKHLAYITPNANNIFIFSEIVYFLFPNANIIICFCQFVVNNFFGVCFIDFLDLNLFTLSASPETPFSRWNPFCKLLLLHSMSSPSANFSVLWRALKW